MRHPTPDPIRPGQESVWDYPRPAIAALTDAHLRILFDGKLLAETRNGVRTLETSHPPSYYFPPADVDQAMLALAGGSASICEWKGQARYFDVVGPTKRASRVGRTAATSSGPSEGMVNGHPAEGVGAGADGEADDHRRRDEDRCCRDKNNDEKQGIVPIHCILRRGTLCPRSPLSLPTTFLYGDGGMLQHRELGQHARWAQGS